MSASIPGELVHEGPAATGVDRELLLDTATLVLGSLFICLYATRPWTMSALVPSLILVRLVLWSVLLRATARELAREVLFGALCTLIGAFNDYNSVVRNGIYDYSAPSLAPGLSTIPLWMLLFWGVILRFLATLTASPWLGGTREPYDLVHLGRRPVSSAALKVALLLALVVITRQCIYRLYLDPWWSWIPFAIALAIYGILFRPRRHDLAIASLAVAVGPLIEVLYIHWAQLHHYHLGWFCGVPLWIVLWWVVAILLWNDLGLRLRRLIERLVPLATRPKDGYP